MNKLKDWILSIKTLSQKSLSNRLLLALKTRLRRITVAHSKLVWRGSCASIALATKLVAPMGRKGPMKELERKTGLKQVITTWR